MFLPKYYCFFDRVWPLERSCVCVWGGGGGGCRSPTPYAYGYAGMPYAFDLFILVKRLFKNYFRVDENVLHVMHACMLLLRCVISSFTRCWVRGSKMAAGDRHRRPDLLRVGLHAAGHHRLLHQILEDTPTRHLSAPLRLLLVLSVSDSFSFPAKLIQAMSKNYMYLQLRRRNWIFGSILYSNGVDRIFPGGGGAASGTLSFRWDTIFCCLYELRLCLIPKDQIIR